MYRYLFTTAQQNASVIMLKLNITDTTMYKEHTTNKIEDRPTLNCITWQIIYPLQINFAQINKSYNFLRFPTQHNATKLRIL